MEIELGTPMSVVMAMLAEECFSNSGTSKPNIAIDETTLSVARTSFRKTMGFRCPICGMELVYGGNHKLIYPIIKEERSYESGLQFVWTCDNTGCPAKIMSFRWDSNGVCFTLEDIGINTEFLDTENARMFAINSINWRVYYSI